MAIDLFEVLFWMPELASYSFHLFYQLSGKHHKSSLLSWKYRFGKAGKEKKHFCLISPKSRLDELVR